MHCTQIGAITLEMDVKLMSLLKELDAVDAVDVTEPKSLLLLAEKLREQAKAALAAGRKMDAYDLVEKASMLEAIATELVKVPQVLLKVDTPTTTAAVVPSTALAPVVSQVSTPTLVKTAVQTPVKPAQPLVLTVPPVPPPVIKEDGTLPAPAIKASDVDGGLGTVGKVAVAGALLGGLWWWMKRRKR